MLSFCYWPLASSSFLPRRTAGLGETVQQPSVTVSCSCSCCSSCSPAGPRFARPVMDGTLSARYFQGVSLTGEMACVQELRAVSTCVNGFVSLSFFHSTLKIRVICENGFLC